MTNGSAVPRCLIASGQRGCWDESGAPIPCSGSGQDGELRPGIPWPDPRFTIAGELARDRLTGLTWTIDANLFEWPLTWSEALDHVAGLRLSHHLGHDDWRLPTRRELWSLVSFANRNPALPEGHPFRGVFLGWYWTSTSAARNSAYAWAVQTSGGRVFFEAKDRRAFAWAMVLHLGRGAIGVGVKRDPRYLVWPVRGPSDSSRAPV